MNAPKRKAVQGHDTRTATKKTNNENPMNAIKSIAAYTRHTCATSRFIVNPYAGMGKLEKARKRAVLQFLPVLENTMYNAGNLPDSEVFSRPEFAGTGFPVPHGYGRDGLVRKAGRMALYMFSTSRPPVALEKAASGLQSHNGAETMTTVNTTTTPEAAPLGITPATFPGSVQRQIAIETALADALYYIRMPYSAKTLNATTARTRRALTLLKQACAEAKNGGEA